MPCMLSIGLLRFVREEVNSNTAAALQFAIQQVHDAGEVYDMALLELIEHWRTTTPFTRLNQKLFCEAGAKLTVP